MSARASGRWYRFAGQLELGVRGGPRAQRHFSAEYGDASCAPAATPADVELELAGALALAGGSARGRLGRHKAARWRVDASQRADGGIDVRGTAIGPLALMFVQTYFVEPLLALVAADRELVLLPAAGFHNARGATVVLGGSGTGKTSLAADRLAAGGGVLGDDQILVTAGGAALPFPRRLRLYPDLVHVAPAAYGSLGSAQRGALRSLAALGAVTGGRLAPPLRVPTSRLGSAPRPAAVPINRVVFVERGGSRTEVQQLERAELLDRAQATIAAQRSVLSRDIPGLRERIERATGLEEAVLGEAFAGVETRKIVIGRHTDAAAAVHRVAESLGSFR